MTSSTSLKTTRSMWKKTLLVMLTVGAMFQTGTAQSFFTPIGNGNTSNSSTGYPSPYGNWYWGSHHQLFITAAEMSAAGVGAGGNIKSIGFNIAATNGAAPHQNWVVTVYTTTATNPIATGMVTSGAVSTSTLTTVTGTIGWNQTNIAPFIWNGTDNIIIETCTFNGSYTYNYSTMMTTTLTGAATKVYYYYEDGVTACNQIDLSFGSSTNTRPDVRIEWEYLTPCAGMPGSNSVITPTFQVCANTPVGLINLASTYSVGGMQYQWYSSTLSAVGPFTPVPSGGSGVGYSVPGLTTTTYYQAVITCTNSLQSYTTLGSPVVVAATTTSNVPYYEYFENIGANDRLPNCSWWATNLGSTLRTYTAAASGNRLPKSGTSFAAFQLPSTNNAMYTNGINLVPGITYSAAAYYATEYFGYNNWTNLSLLIGPNQTAVGQTNIASVSPAISGAYKLISGTFTVSSPGLYYLAVRANGVPGSAAYLMIDDISVTIPCTPVSGNSPTLTLAASATTVCAGDQVNLTAAGGDSYSWSNGGTGSNIVITPLQSGFYSVTGTNSLTGCAQTVQQYIYVNTSPTVFVIADAPSACAGQAVHLSAYGASSYAWSNGGNGGVITVNPQSTTTYDVIGTNALGCSGVGSQQVTVKPLPAIGVLSSNPGDMCIGEVVTLNASGGVSYQWYSSSSSVLLSGSNVNVSPNTSTTYTVIGTGANGCTNKATVSQNVAACQGIQSLSSANGIKVYPNPAHNEVSVELSDGSTRTLELVDISGRVLIEKENVTGSVSIDLSHYANGIYYAKIRNGNGVDVVKIVKE
jgi:hypothetical protein